MRRTLRDMKSAAAYPRSTRAAVRRGGLGTGSGPFEAAAGAAAFDVPSADVAPADVAPDGASTVPGLFKTGP